MPSLKVLHLTDGGLDDSRVISAALTGKKSDYKVFFCGEKTTD